MNGSTCPPRAATIPAIPSDGGRVSRRDPDLLEDGKSYLFVTRTNAAGDEHTVVLGMGNLPLDVAKDMDRSTVLESDDANQLRTRFQDAIDNQIEYDPNEVEEPAEGESSGGSRDSSR